MKQLVYPKTNIPYTGGWCLAAVETAFNTPHLYGSATEAWAKAKLKHTDRPSKISVPIYFSMDSEPNGHIAIHLSDGMVASTSQSGTHVGLYIHPSIDSMIEYYRPYHPTIKYLGWSEDLAGITLVKEESMLTDINNLKYIYMGIYGQSPDVVLDKNDPAIGKDYATITEKCLDYANKNGVAYWQVKPKLLGEIADLKKQVTDLQNKPPQIVTKEVVVEKIVTKEVPIGFDDLSIGELLSEAFKKLFKIK